MLLCFSLCISVCCSCRRFSTRSVFSRVAFFYLIFACLLFHNRWYFESFPTSPLSLSRLCSSWVCRCWCWCVVAMSHTDSSLSLCPSLCIFTLSYHISFVMSNLLAPYMCTVFTSIRRNAIRFCSYFSVCMYKRALLLSPYLPQYLRSHVWYYNVFVLAKTIFYLFLLDYTLRIELINRQKKKKKTKEKARRKNRIETQDMCC